MNIRSTYPTHPFPKHSHDWFPIQIGIGPSLHPRTAIGRANVTRKVRAMALSTCHASLFVHPTYPNHDVDAEVIAAGRVVDWTVTHEPTGTMVMTGIPDERTAMYPAGAVGRLWWWVHPEDASGTGNVPDYQREFNRLPMVVRDWIKSWGYKD